MNFNLIIAIALLAAVVLIWLVLSYKGFLKLKYSVEEAFETTEVYLKRRHELIKKVTKAAKTCENCDLQLTEAISQMKNAAQKADSIEEKVSCENEISGLLGEWMEQAGASGKASKALDDTCRQLIAAEDDIEHFARFYNTLVKMLNTRVASFPSNLIAKLFHFTAKPMLDAVIGSKRS
ncbi:LemA family protein [Anaerovorax odorimutans]|uniref:LemA family protein n=1 Tax=Anaerovorax odorimutans TaxID=109327 RepID=A0ABT1RR01_9FIRM|nr:LemA family protein [Anaerovorax odorimutans]MCQ4637623.1 LemA family protein [Anaerovorax odorimutans]